MTAYPRQGPIVQNAAIIELPVIGVVSAFWVGTLGSLIVEIGTCARASANTEGDIPARYKKLPYLFVRLLLALGGGTLAVVFGAETALTAFYFGASAPIVLDKLAQGAIPTIPTNKGPGANGGMDGDG